MNDKVLRIIAYAIMLAAALASLWWLCSTASAQGFENVCTCEQFPVCWFVAAQGADGSPGDGTWEWLPWREWMLARNIAAFGPGWVCTGGGM